MKCFLDTYALVEMVNGNPSFQPYLREGVTNVFNLLEFHVAVCRLQSAAVADASVLRMRSRTVPIEVEDVLVASEFKRDKASKTVSFADALGYAMAQRRKIPFVTGDKAFKGRPGVLP